MKTTLFFALALVLSSGLLAQDPVTTAVPTTIDFQGRLHDSGGSPVNATLNITFSLYSVSTSGTALWTETRSVQVVDGLFQIKLGESTPIDPGHFSGTDRWLGIKVGAEAEMSPRTKISSVGYAMQAGNAENLWTLSGNNIYFNTGNIGIGTDDPTQMLDLNGQIRIRGGVPAFGRLLTSDANGVANWQEPSQHIHSASDLTGILPLTSGGTGASTAAAARTNLGATMVGTSLFILPNPSAIRYIRTNVDNRITLRTPDEVRIEIGAGTVSSLNTSDGISGGPITTSGTISLEGQSLALHNLSTNGFIVRTGTGTFATRYLNDGAGIVITNQDGVSGNPTISAKTYDIGDWAFGGIVVWVDATGQHGFVCAKSDQDGGAGVRWNAGTDTWTMAMGDGPLAGKSNTVLIIASQSRGDGSTYAARLCNELQQTQNYKSYGDWYLPSEDELYLMYQNRTAINNTAALYAGSTPFAAAIYWSSKEYNNTLARYVNFSNGNVGSATKGQHYRVRAVRTF